MQTETRSNDKLTIGVLYGFRALMVLFVCNYHIWQQGWLGQYVFLFGRTWDFDFWTRSSYVFVDGMILLSGFLLYLPYARQAEYGTPVPGAKRFYFNRLARIVPSYAVSVILMLFLFALPGGSYRDAAAANFDVITHLTFTFTFFKETYLFSPLNGVLWTVAIEMQLYLVFPLLAKAVRKQPVITLCAMAGVGMLFRLLMARYVNDLAIWVNQLPAFLDVYALGILGAILYMKLHKRVEQAAESGALRRGVAIATPVLFIAGCFALAGILQLQTTNGLVGHNELRLSQWLLRLPLALTLLLLMLSAAFLPRALQKGFDNRLMRFLSTISFNLYIWHQVLSVQIAKNLFPDTLHSSQPLQIAYTLLCFALSTIIAMAATYGLEQPAARLLERARRRCSKNRPPKIQIECETINHERSQGTEALPPTDSLLVRTETGAAGTD